MADSEFAPVTPGEILEEEFLAESPEYWLNLQAHHDLKMARRALSPEAEAEIRRQRAA